MQIVVKRGSLKLDHLSSVCKSTDTVAINFVTICWAIMYRYFR